MTTRMLTLSVGALAAGLLLAAAARRRRPSSERPS